MVAQHGEFDDLDALMLELLLNIRPVERSKRKLLQLSVIYDIFGSAGHKATGIRQ